LLVFIFLQGESPYLDIKSTGCFPVDSR